MRAWWWVAVAAVVVVAGVGVQPAAGQRTSSRLTQMMQTMMSSVGDLANRIGSGIIRTMGGSPGQVRAIPPPRQRNARPLPRPLDDDALLPAPNAPKPPRQRKERPSQSRMSFRRFVDTTMAGFANIIPRMRRRSFNRRHTRDVEVSPPSPSPSGTFSGISGMEGVSPSLSLPPHSPSSHSSNKAIHVTVNVFHGHPAEGAGGAGGAGPGLPHDALTVSHYPNHTVDLLHHYPERGDDGPDSLPEPPLSLAPSYPSPGTEEPFQPVSWPSLSSADSFQTPKFPTFTDFLSDLNKDYSWQDDPRVITGIPGYASAAPAAPADHYPAAEVTEDPKMYNQVNQVTGGEVEDVRQTNTIKPYPGHSTGRPGLPAGGSRYHEVSYSGGGSMYVGEGQEGSSLVSQVVPPRSQGDGVRGAGCGMRCLWGDLMSYLDHYSSTKDTDASVGAPLLTQKHHHHHNPPHSHTTRPQHPGLASGRDAHTHPQTNAREMQRLATTNNANTDFGRRPPSPHPSLPLPPRGTAGGHRNHFGAGRDKVRSPPALLQPGPPYSTRPARPATPGRRLGARGSG